ncbi:MAG: Asp/Glu racemase [Pseudomonadota bacterium]
MSAAFDTDDGAALRGALGLIVLATDETMEPELSHILPEDGAALYHTRIPSAPDVTPETLAQMEADLPDAAALLPKRPYDVIGYGCTSGATVIGPERIAALIGAACETRAVTDPLTAIIAACRAFDATRIGFVTPYLPSVSLAMRRALEAAGLEIANFTSFEQQSEATVARIAEASTLAAMEAVAEGADVIFASCTNLRSFGVVAEAEARTRLPVLSSNLALGWHMARLSGTETRSGAPGRIFTKSLP